MLGKRNTALLLAAVMAAVCLFGCTPAGQADSLRPQSAPPLAVQPWTAGEADAQFDLPGEVRSAVWLDNGEPLPMVQRDGHVTVSPKPFIYGRSLVVRVAKLELV